MVTRNWEQFHFFNSESTVKYILCSNARSGTKMPARSLGDLAHQKRAPHQINLMEPEPSKPSTFLLGGGPIGFVLILLLHYNFGRHIFLLIHFNSFKFPTCFLGIIFMGHYQNRNNIFYPFSFEVVSPKIL